MMNHLQMMIMGPTLPVTSQSQQVLNNQNSQLLMNQLINPSHMMMYQSQSQGRLNNRGGGYGTWPPQKADQLNFKNQNANPSGYDPSSLTTRNNKIWKVKKANDKRNNNNRKELPVSINGGGNLGHVAGAGSYNPPGLLKNNRLKARPHFSKRKFNHGGKSTPFAPRNTTSFLIRAKKSGGITSLVSPSPVTPAVLPTPVFSPSSEVLVDTAREEWGVDGYGSMKGLIRLRSPGNDEDEEGGSSESDVEEHLELERRLDHDLNRFEMIYPNYGVNDHNSCLLEHRVDDQGTHIAQLEEENLTLKERLFLMESEFNSLRSRLQSLELQRQGFIKEVVDNGSENEESNELLEESKVDNKESDNGVKKLQGIEGANVGEADVHMKDIQKIKENTDYIIEANND